MQPVRTTSTLLLLTFPFAVPAVHTSCIYIPLFTNHSLSIHNSLFCHPTSPQTHNKTLKKNQSPTRHPAPIWPEAGMGQGPEFKLRSTGNDCSPWHPGPDLSTPPLFICLCPTTYSLLGHVGQDAPITFTLSPPNWLVCLVVSFTASACKTVKQRLFGSKLF